MATPFILAGDIGGTTARLALFESGMPTGRPTFEALYEDTDFADFSAIIARFRVDSGIAEGRAAIGHACLGAAGAIAGRRVQLTNSSLLIDADAVSTLLGGAPVTLLNDFEAAAHGIPALTPADFTTLQVGAPRPAGAQVVIGAGTGLGVAYRISNGSDYQVVSGEGGHAGFAPTDREQTALQLSLLAELGRVSAEHVVSGPGLVRIHAFLRATSGAGEATKEAAEVSRRALQDRDPLALRALDMLISCYGAVAGDHALAVRAYGGVYVAGGVAAKNLARLSAGGFLASFNAKGTHAGLVGECPVHVVTTHRLGLLGAARAALADPRRADDNA